MSKLYILKGKDKGRSFDLEYGKIYTIGRAPNNEIQIRDKSISRKHIKIFSKDNKYFIVDLESQNGTLVNGNPIKPGNECEVGEGFPIVIGNTLIGFGKRHDQDDMTTQYLINISEQINKRGEDFIYKDRRITDRKNLELIYEVSTILMQTLDINELCEKIMDSLFSSLKRIDSGVILLLDNETGKLEEIISRARDSKKSFKMNYSRTIVNRVISEGQAIVMSDTSQEDDDKISDSIEMMRIKSIICVPLICKSETMGVVYVHSVKVAQGFRKNDLYLLTGLSGPAALAINNALLYARGKHVEGALLESEEKHRNLFETMTQGVVYQNAEGEIISANPSAERILGLSLDQMRGRTSIDSRWKSIHEDGSDFLGETHPAMVALRTGKKAENVVMGIFNPNEKGYRWISINAVPQYRQGENKPYEVHTTFDDITARRRAEREWETTFNTMSDWISLIDQERRIQRTNHGGDKLVGVPPPQIVGQVCCKLLHGAEEPIAGCPFEKMMETHDQEIVECNIPETDRWLRITVDPVMDEHGELIGAVHIVREITDQKKMQLHFQQAQRMESISTLAGGIAHQFNNALSAISGNIDLIKMDFPTDEKINKYIISMRDSAQRMAQLTDQLLAYARGGKYQAKNISLSDFVRDTLPLVKHNIKPSICIETDLPRDIKSVYTDMTQMQMVMSAILSNSSEAIEDKGRIRVTCRNEEVTDEIAKDLPGLKTGSYVTLMVEDDGKGMDEEIKSRVFEPFFTTKFQGRGLGMAAAYGIVKNHDGWIFIDSELGIGTTVRIYLPPIEEKVKEAKKPQIELPKGTGTVLVIEDEEMVMDVTCSLLEKLGYRILGAKTGKEAVNIAKTFDGDIDLAILDIVLPDMGGKDIYPLIMEARPNLKVIVCSGYSIDGPAQEILDAGALGFLQKPFSIEVLSEKLKEAFISMKL